MRWWIRELDMATMTDGSSTKELGEREGTLHVLLRALVRNPATLFAGVVLLLLVSGALFAPLLAPFPPGEMHVEDRMRPPSSEYLLGTDAFGRDTLSRLLHGARVSMVVSVLAVFIAMFAGTAIGSLAGLLGGWVDELVMRVIDMVMAFPYIVLAITLVTLLGPGLGNVVFVIGVLRVPDFARVSRSGVLILKNQEFVLAAEALGQTRLMILLRHLLPNFLPTLTVVASLAAGTATTGEAALSFLGLGVQPPTASWGNMLADGQRLVFSSPWLAFFPGLMITLTVLAFNLLGDALRDVTDPRFRR